MSTFLVRLLQFYMFLQYIELSHLKHFIHESGRFQPAVRLNIHYSFEFIILTVQGSDQDGFNISKSRLPTSCTGCTARKIRTRRLIAAIAAIVNRVALNDGLSAWEDEP